MLPSNPRTTDVLVRCDVGPGVGVGHLMRCVALAEELRRRGLSVTFCADVDSVPFARRQLASRGISVIASVETPQEHVALVRRLRPQLVVLDSYLLPEAVYAAVRAESAVLLAIVDGPPGGRQADLYLDQNLGAEEQTHALTPGATRLAGLTFALMRDSIVVLRPREPHEDRDIRAPRVLAFFGGTDAFGASPATARLLVATGRPFRATIVAGDDEARESIERLVPEAGQQIDVIAPTDELAMLVSSTDVVISAAGTSAWELMCLGAACALVWVADNQHESYARAVESGLGIGLGSLEDVSGPTASAVRSLRELLDLPERRRELRSRAWRAVDGRGRERVADALLERVAADGSQEIE